MFVCYILNWVNFCDTDIMNATDLQTVMPGFGTCNSELVFMHININTQQQHATQLQQEQNGL